MFKIITIPFDAREKAFDTGPLNEFVQNKKILSSNAVFFQEEMGHYWCVFLQYEPIKEKHSEKEAPELDDRQSRLLDKLKVWRRQKAEAQGVPVYVIATNRELEDVVIKKPDSIAALKTIRGFGKSKVERHGKEIIECIGRFDDRT